MILLVLMLSVAVGPVIVHLFKPQDRKKIRLLTTFSGAYVFSVTALHLMPEAFGGGHEHGHDHEGEGGGHAHLAGALIMGGFFVQVMLDYFSHGIEHGHAHVHDHDGKVPVGILAGLCVHAFVEGMPLAAHENGISEEVRHALLAGIVMHNVPVSIVLMTLLLHQGVRMKPALGWMLVFGLMSPLGMLLSEHVAVLAHYSRELMAVVVGIFLHISTTILFETGEEHRFNKMKVLAIIAGAGIAVITAMIETH